MKISFLKSLKIILSVIALIIIGYNALLASEILYDADGDAANFIELGVNLAKNQKYGISEVSFEELMQDFRTGSVASKEYDFLAHSTWRPPVWPFLIAGVFLIFGYNLYYVLIFKFLLHGLGIFLFRSILKELKLREGLVVIGTFLFAVHPAWQLYSRVFLSEPITLFFITLWLFYLVRYLNKKNSWWPQAVIGGILILSHPYYVFLPFSVWLFLFLQKQMRLKFFLVSAVVCASIVFLWILRNSMVLETDKIILTTSTGAVMAKGWNGNVPEEHTNTQGDLANEGLVLEDFEYDKTNELDELERMQLYKDATLYFIKTNPELILPIIGKKLMSAFNPFPETRKPGILEGGRTIFQVLALLALLYLLIFFKNKFILSLILGLLLATIAMTIVVYSGFRFRMPQVGIEVIVIIVGINLFIMNSGISKVFISPKDRNFKS